METVIDRNNLPPDIDESQVFTAEEFSRLQKDINLAEEIEKFKDYPDFPSEIDVNIFEIYVNEKYSLRWIDGVIDFQIYLPTDLIPESSTMYINEELAYIFLNEKGEALFSRINNSDYHSSMERKNEILRSCTKL
ncbi:hypothetical protein [Crocosphaera sp. Alani8]|uniref:hypothetical protein n=1 Tax=Crocosphaera sp. Alani8 TaxID=3038952 RepID=UPI00313B4A64